MSSTPPVMDYRRPGTPSAPDVAAALLRRQRMSQLKSVARLVVGVPLSFVGPWVVASFLWFILWRFGVRGVDWWVYFLGSCAVVIPLLYRLEWNTRGEWHTQEMRAQGTTTSDLMSASSYGEWQMRRDAAALAAWVEILLIPARMVLGAAARLRAERAVAGVDRGRAAQVLVALAASDKAVPVRQLLGAGESPEQLRRTLHYLALFDWADVSSDGHRAWILSEARRALFGGT